MLRNRIISMGCLCVLFLSSCKSQQRRETLSEVENAESSKANGIESKNITLYLADPGSLSNFDVAGSEKLKSESNSDADNIIVFEKKEKSRKDLDAFVQNINGKDYYVFVNEGSGGLGLSGSSIFETAPRSGGRSVLSGSRSNIREFFGAIARRFSRKPKNPKATHIDDADPQVTEGRLVEKQEIEVTNLERTRVVKFSTKRGIKVSKVELKNENDAEFLESLSLPPNATDQEIVLAFKNEMDAITRDIEKAIDVTNRTISINSLAASSPRFMSISTKLLDDSTSNLKVALENRVASQPNIASFQSLDALETFAKQNMRINSLGSLLKEASLANLSAKPFQMQTTVVFDKIIKAFRDELPPSKREGELSGRERDLFDMFLQVRKEGKTGQDLNLEVAKRYVEMLHPRFKGLNKEAVDLQNLVIDVLNGQRFNISEYFKIQKFKEGALATNGQTIQDLLRSDRVSNEELTVLYHAFINDEFIHGMISENLRKRPGLQDMIQQSNQTMHIQ